jgi:hypothetical protein
VAPRRGHLSPCVDPQALALYQQLPPAAILAKNHLRLQQCVAPLAYKQPDHSWQVPSNKGQASRDWPRQRLERVLSLLAGPGVCGAPMLTFAVGTDILAMSAVALRRGRCSVCVRGDIPMHQPLSVAHQPVSWPVCCCSGQDATRGHAAHHRCRSHCGTGYHLFCTAPIERGE